MNDTHRLGRAPLQHGEVQVADRLLDQRGRWSVVEDLPVTFGGASSVRSATSWRIGSIERRVSASISRRVSSTRRGAFGVELLASASRCASATLRASERIASASQRPWRDERLVLLEQLVRLLAGAVGLLDRLPDPLAPLVMIADWTRLKANFLRTKNTIAKRIRSRSSDPGVILISGEVYEQLYLTSTKASSPPSRP